MKWWRSLSIMFFLILRRDKPIGASTSLKTRIKKKEDYTLDGTKEAVELFRPCQHIHKPLKKYVVDVGGNKATAACMLGHTTT